VNGATLTSLNDFNAWVTAKQSVGEIIFEAHGQMLTASRAPSPSEEILYHMIYRLSETGAEIVASVNELPARREPIQLIVPVIAREGERMEQIDSQTGRVLKAKGALTVSIDASYGFDASFKEKTFNLVPGFEAFPFNVVLAAGKEARIRLKAR
jgi:hypothetical protein